MKKNVSAGGEASRRLPVSQKFFDSLLSRIAMTVSFLSDPDGLVERMTLIFEAYMRSGAVPTRAVGLDPLLIFTLLRPEVDKAMERSRRARQRALDRRLRREAAASGSASESQAAISGSLPVEDQRGECRSVPSEGCNAESSDGRIVDGGHCAGGLQPEMRPESGNLMSDSISEQRKYSDSVRNFP